MEIIISSKWNHKNHFNIAEFVVLQKEEFSNAYNFIHFTSGPFTDFIPGLPEGGSSE
jgi:hypothetical protein